MINFMIIELFLVFFYTFYCIPLFYPQEDTLGAFLDPKILKKPQGNLLPLIWFWGNPQKQIFQNLCQIFRFSNTFYFILTYLINCQNFTPWETLGEINRMEYYSYFLEKILLTLAKAYNPFYKNVYNFG